MRTVTLTLSLPDEFTPTTWLETIEEIRRNFLEPLAEFVHANKLGEVRVSSADATLLLCDYEGFQGLHDLRVAVFFRDGTAKSCRSSQLDETFLVDWEMAAKDMFVFFRRQIRTDSKLQEIARKLAKAGDVLQKP